jgi:hypothetical protein
MNVGHRTCGLCDFELSQAVLDVNSVWEAVAPGIETFFDFQRFHAFVSPLSGKSLGVDYEIVRCDHCRKALFARSKKGVMVLPTGMEGSWSPPVSVTAGHQRFCFCSNRCAAELISASDEDEFRNGYPLSW